MDAGETLHGETIPDPYRWLEDGDSPEVRDWTEAQGRHTAAVLGRLPFRDALRERLRTLFSIGLVTPPVRRGGRYFHQRRAGGEEQPILYFRDGAHGTDRVLLDPATLGPDRTTALDWWYPSKDGALIAYGKSAGGTEMSTLYVRDVATGKDLPDVIPNTQRAALAWDPDGKSFVYTRHPAKG